jgi:hypothetical protein
MSFMAILIYYVFFISKNKKKSIESLALSMLFSMRARKLQFAVRQKTFSCTFCDKVIQ